MKIHHVKPLYENVFHLINDSLKARRVHETEPTEQTELEYQQAVKYLSLLVGFMAVDKHTRSTDEETLRSYAPIGLLYRGTVEETRSELDKFFAFLNGRGKTLDVGSKNPIGIVQQYEKLFSRNDPEQWNNVCQMLINYFKTRATSNTSNAA